MPIRGVGFGWNVSVGGVFMLDLKSCCCKKQVQVELAETERGLCYIQLRDGWLWVVFVHMVGRGGDLHVSWAII